MKRSIFCGALNIRFHDIENSYGELFDFLMSLKHSIRVFGDTHLRLKKLDDIEYEGAQAILGVIYKYTRIDFDADWLNEETGNPATPREKEDIAIPENLHPNLGIFYFIFVPDTHKFYYETYGVYGQLSQKMVQTYFDSTFAREDIRARFGSLEVDIISDRAGIDEVLGLAQLRRLEIEISRPNPDDFPHDTERRFQERLRRLRAKKQKIELEAANGQSLEPDEEVRDLVLVATRNGNAKSYGKDEAGLKAERELQDKPLERGRRYDPEHTNEFQAFVSAVDKTRDGIYEPDSEENLDDDE
jgi:hypothetical protein